MSESDHRATIFAEDATIVSHESFPSNQYILRVSAPRTARSAMPGSFAHITCDDAVRLRRPLSIMRVDAAEAWVEFLYKPVGHGLAQLAMQEPGDTLSILAPIGRGFGLDPAKPRVLAIGGGVGIPPMIFLAETIRESSRFTPIVLMGSEVPFPFDLTASRIPVGGVTAEASHGVALLEDWGIASRLASLAGFSGCHAGYVTELADGILRQLSAAELTEVQICACGPEPMLAATAELARSYDVACELSLEEYMACGVGGCAGCTVLVHTAEGPAMKRVCVDGPVFAANEVYPGKS